MPDKQVMAQRIHGACMYFLISAIKILRAVWLFNLRSDVSVNTFSQFQYLFAPVRFLCYITLEAGKRNLYTKQIYKTQNNHNQSQTDLSFYNLFRI